VRLGVDLGGTGTRVVALTDDGQIAGERIAATRSFQNGGGSTPAQALVELLQDVAGEHRIHGVGIGASGPIDAGGIVRNRDTLPVFSDLPLAATVSEQLGVPCAIDSDAVAFALGEYRFGAGRGAGALIAVTLGTGIGGCVLHAGRPHRGGDGLHPELGHLPVPGGPAPCYCGLDSCWEQLASRTALGALTAEAGFTDPDAAAAAARDGDARALTTFDYYGRLVGIGLATLCTAFRPERVVIGGGAAPYVELFRGGLEAAVDRTARYTIALEVRAAELGAVAGAVGAATLTNPATTGT
jgi:glucokinase